MARANNVIHLDHVNFDKVLNVLQETVKALVTGEGRDRQKEDLLYSIIYYIRMYPDRVHHPKEEECLFPILLKKCPDVLDLIEKLKGQHAEGAGRIRELTEALNAFSASPDNARDRLMNAASAFVTFQRDHIGLEERELLPKAVEVLSSEDWNHIEKAFRSNVDPVFGENVETGFQSLFNRITASNEG